MQRSSTPTCSIPLLILLTLLILQNGVFVKLAEGGKKKIHIPDDLDDVVDDEEDEEWKKWGEKTKNDEFDPPKIDPNMDPLAFQAEMMKRHVGPSFGFVKLRFGVKRTPDMVAEIAMKWTRILKTGSVESRFMGVDLSTIMFTLVKGQDTTELMEFILSQPESYEIKIGDQTFRRPGDPPLDEVLEKRRSEEAAEDSSPVEEKEESKDEL